ncbi:MAG: 5-formyltetrahydrofolate cyclo-ligase [Deltaproteobacteria bacterium]|nr:5-formyltetrahydrofolate cyclo-ligase [Deltaproteobacteria bacterium]
MHDEKKQLRKLLRSQRRALSPIEVTAKSRLIAERLRAFAPFQQASALVLYSADENEVQTELIWQDTIAQGKAVYYPRITADRADLEFVRRSPGDRLIPGTFGILIPPGEELLAALHETDIVLTPGVGFDRQGHRLGRGKGYYDRAFRGVLSGALRVALAHTFQVVSHIPATAHDERVQYILTEAELIDCPSADCQ